MSKKGQSTFVFFVVIAVLALAAIWFSEGTQSSAVTIEKTANAKQRIVQAQSLNQLSIEVLGLKNDLAALKERVKNHLLKQVA
jgi:hypothetical protein